MIRKTLFPAWLGVLLLWSCRPAQQKTVPEQGTDTAETIRGNLDKIADCLSLAQAGDSVAADVSETGELPDSLMPVHVYTFDYSDPSFPNSIESKWGAMIKGFDTDGEGRLYIAGGVPIRLVCYNEQQKEYDVVISNDTIGDGDHAIMALMGDSVLYVEEGLNRLAILSKDGTGEVRYHDLPLQETDSITDGRFFNESLVLYVHDGSEEARRREESSSDHFRFEYRKNIHSCEVFPPAWNEREAVWDARKISYWDPFHDDNYDGDRFTFDGKWYDYLGTYHGMHLYFFYDLGDIPCFIALVDDEQNVKAKTRLAQRPFIDITCGSEEHWGSYSSINLYRLKGYSFFFGGYELDTPTISFLEYDLKPLFDKANASLSVEAEEQVSDKHAVQGNS